VEMRREMPCEWASEGEPNPVRAVGETEQDLRDQNPAYDGMHERTQYASSWVAPQEFIIALVPSVLMGTRAFSFCITLIPDHH